MTGSTQSDFDLLSMQPGDRLELVVGTNSWNLTRGHGALDHTHRVSGFSIMTNDEQFAAQLGALPSEVRVTRFIGLGTQLIVRTPGTNPTSAGPVAVGFLWNAETAGKDSGIQVI